ncbi:MAG: outer membrane protein assembly factor BamA [Candidatus Dasytiphilus stammeri]
MLVKILFIIILVFFYTFLFAEQKIFVQNICVHGLYRISTITTLMNFPIRIGDKIYREDINNSIKALFRTNNFDDVHILRDSNTLIIQLKERPIISFIKILNNNVINNTTLINWFNKIDLHPGQIFNYTPFYLIEKKIQNYYFYRGYYNATVKMIIFSLPHHAVGITIFLKEGKPVTIYKINIVGYKAFNDRELSQNFFLLHDKNSSLSWYKKFLNDKKRKYQKKILYQDLERLRQFYLSHGYINFKLISTKVNLTPNKENIIITINISEGIRYKFNKIIFKGNFLINKNDRKKILFIRNEKWYNFKQVKLLKKCIFTLLQNYGYILPSIYIKEIINNDNNTINLIINIHTGQRYYVHRIFFQGNYLTQDLVLQRQIVQKEGKWFNEDLVKKSQNRLYNTGFFQTVSTNVQRVPALLNSVDIIYQLKELEEKGHITIGLGWDGKKHLSYHFKIFNSNWLGTAYTMAFRITKSDNSKHSDITIINPHFTSKGFNIRKKIFFNNLYNLDIAKYEHKHYGFNDDIKIPISSHNFIKIGIGYANNDLSNIQPQIHVWNYLRYNKIHPDLLSQIKYTESNFNFKTGWIYNNLNQKIFPTSGVYNKILSKIYVPLPISQWHFHNLYYKITLDSRVYIIIPIMNYYNTWAFLAHGYFGYTSTFLKTASPFFEHFYAGDLTYLRGFHINTIGTRAIFYNSTSYLCKNKTKPLCFSKDSIGGNFMTVTSFELLAPIINPNILHNFFGLMRSSIFLDIGTVILVNNPWKNLFIIKNYSINSNLIRISTGINLRWISPWGPIIVVYSKPLKKNAVDQVESFQFNFGINW